MLCFFFYIHHPCTKDCGTRARSAFISSCIISAVVKSPFLFLSSLSALLNLSEIKWKVAFVFWVALGWREQEEDEEHLGSAPGAEMPLAQSPGLKMGWKRSPSHITYSSCLIWWDVSLSAPSRAQPYFYWCLLDITGIKPLYFRTSPPAR